MFFVGFFKFFVCLFIYIAHFVCSHFVVVVVVNEQANMK